MASLAARDACAQAHSSNNDFLQLGAQAIGVVTRVSPAIHSENLTEGYLTQPVVMAHIDPWRGLLTLSGMLDFEGATIERGELNAGIYGEGYIDRRHPHTYLHELVLSSTKRFGSNAVSGVSATLGKGFAPFGTDDPMSRPFEKYPINHHLSQIPERVIGVGALRAGGWIFELGAFNGDEPTGPGDTPNADRYWDSWSGRVTFIPWPQGEIQTSYARVKSPENPAGGGADQRKQSASVRLEDAQHSGYALFEWSKTGEYAGGTQSFTFTSLLAETWARYDRLSGALRIEHTERPDEQRTTDEFRTSVPPTDLSIAGRSRWTIVTARVAASLLNKPELVLEPFVEIAHARVSPTLRPSGFDPRQFYGSSRIWSVSIGAKLAFSMAHMRMGRYGVAVSRKPAGGMGGMHMEGM
ncbi:MAG TPA: hypothetical protein VGN73_11760 [Gemmatimonadaceae bacterium]|nr:hypothetical protein [Gemmatimonadaceae bacterium]